ncbi:MAG: hypothetical protein OXT69_14225 [Candidatus Poribacteria bacterium]|nr:hypothetical protein [Candidatus Poribacteria bacterium]
MQVLIRTTALTIAAAMALPSFAGVWQDNFENEGLDDWEIFNFAPGVESWEERTDEDGNGVLTGWIEQADSFSILELKPEGADPAQWNNYTVRVRARLDSELVGEFNTYFGLWLYSNIDRGIYHECYINPQIARAGTAGIWSRIGDSFGTFQRGQNFEQGVWYNIKASVETIDRNRDRITFQIDDNEPLVVTWASSIGSGGVGLVVYYGTVSFDDFELDGAFIPFDGAPNGGGALSVDPKQKSAQIWGELKSR